MPPLVRREGLGWGLDDGGMDSLQTSPIDDGARARYFTRPGSARRGYGWGRVIAAFVLLAVAITVLSAVSGLLAAAIAPIDESGRAASPAGQIVHLALPVASWWIAVIGVARLLFGMRVGDLFSHARRIRWRLLVMSLVVGLVGFGASAAIGVHVANNVVSLSAGVLRGEDLLGGQADVSASMIELGIQLAFAALICLWVVLLSRRERRGA